MEPESEFILDGVTYSVTSKDTPKAEAPAHVRRFKVGDRVRVVNNQCGGHEVGTVGVIVDLYRRMSYHMVANGKTYAQYDDELEPAPPAPAPLKYAPGQVVMVPMVVKQVDTDDIPYEMEPLTDSDHDIGRAWYLRSAVEPPAPAVGDTCWFWDSDGDVPRKGKLSRVDLSDIELPYLAEFANQMPDHDWFAHCVRANDPD